MSADVATFVQQLINGLTLGSVYGLIAIGYTMVYGIIGMINFAHGDIYMIGAFHALILILVLGFFGITWVPLALAIVLVVGVALTTRGARGKPLPHATAEQFNPPFQLLTADGNTAQITDKQLMIILVTVGLMIGFTTLIRRTALGRQQRACEQDMKMAALLGVNIDRTISLTFVIGAALACVAGLMVTLYYGFIDFYIGFVAGIKAFSAAVLGGIGSLPGAMLGGLLLGFIEVFFSGYVAADYKDVAAFGVLVLVLIFRPTGLLGRPEVE